MLITSWDSSTSTYEQHTAATSGSTSQGSTMSNAYGFGTVEYITDTPYGGTSYSGAFTSRESVALYSRSTTNINGWLNINVNYTLISGEVTTGTTYLTRASTSDTIYYTEQATTGYSGYLSSSSSVSHGEWA